jgi:hypothetical protein
VVNDAAAARVKAQAQATHQRNLVKIGVRPNDPLMLVPKGPGPSWEEVQNIRKQVAGQMRKRNLGDTEGLVSDFRRFGIGQANLAFSRVHAHIVPVVIWSACPGLAKRACHTT